MGPEMIQCLIDDFLEQYAPFNPDSWDMVKCMAFLEDNKLLSYNLATKYYSWTTLLPSQTQNLASKYDTYHPISKICGVLQQYMMMHGQPKAHQAICQYKEYPNHTNNLEVPGSSHKADADFGLLKNHQVSEEQARECWHISNIPCQIFYKVETSEAKLLDVNTLE